MKMTATLDSVFPDWLTGGGIFSSLSSFNVPWSPDVAPVELDVEYFGGLSGDKIASPLLRRMVEGEVATEEERTKIASVIFSICGKNWNKLWDTTEFEYNPIENYNMVEEGNDGEELQHGHTITRTNNLTHGKTGTETTTPNLTNTRADEVYGFNSTDPVPIGGQESTSTGSQTLTHNVSDTDTGTVTDRNTGTDNKNNTHRLTRSGNIGVTTSQQMIQSERDLWAWNFFRDVVFPDLDRFLALEVY